MRISEYSEADKILKNICAFVTDRESEQILNTCFAQLEISETEIVRGDVVAAISRYKSQPSPSLLIVDISQSEMPLSDMDNLAKVCSPDVQVIAIGQEDSVGLYRSLLSCGVSDYLVKPLPRALLQSTLKALHTGEAMRSTTTGKLVTLVGATGGVGGTSILCSLSDILSREEGRKVMLIDPDTVQGDVALHFGVAAGRGFSSLLKSPERLDTLVLDRVAQPVSSRLDLLCSQDEIGTDGIWPDNSMPALIGTLRSRYHYIFVDMPGQITNGLFSLIEQSDICLIVLEPSLSGLRNTKNLLKRMEKAKTGSRAISILNNTRPALQSGLSLSRIEAFLKRKPDYILPYDGRHFCAANLKGEPVSRGGGKAVSVLRKIACDLAGQSVEPKLSLLKSSLKLLRG